MPLQNILQRRSVQTALRFLEEFCENTSIHGLSNLARRNRHWLEFTFWLFTIISVTAVAIHQSVDLISQYKGDNVVISIHTDFKDFNTTKPSFTFCPRDEVADWQVDKYIREHSVGSDVSREDLKYFLQQISSMTISTIKPMKDLNYGISPNDYMKLAFKMSHFFKAKKFEEIPLIKTVSDVGICYTINNFLINNGTSSIHWDDHTKDPTSQKMLHDDMSFSYLEIPTTVYLNYFSTYMRTYIHSPYEMPTTWTRVVGDSNSMPVLVFFYNIAEVSYDSDLIRYATIDQRQCRTNEESNLRMFPETYSRNLCLMECRAQFALRHCNCLPHFYGRMEFLYSHPMNICDVKGLNCLANYTEILRNLESSKDGILKCSCLQNCHLMHIKTAIWGHRLQFSNEFPMKYIYAKHGKQSMIKYKRSIILTNIDFGVAVGNVFGFFFGSCLLSYMEIAYFFSLRLYWFRRGYRGGVQWIRH